MSGALLVLCVVVVYLWTNQNGLESSLVRTRGVLFPARNANGLKSKSRIRPQAFQGFDPEEDWRLERMDQFPDPNDPNIINDLSPVQPPFVGYGRANWNKELNKTVAEYMKLPVIQNYLASLNETGLADFFDGLDKTDHPVRYIYYKDERLGKSLFNYLDRELWMSPGQSAPGVEEWNDFMDSLWEKQGRAGFMKEKFMEANVADAINKLSDDEKAEFQRIADMYWDVLRNPSTPIDFFYNLTYQREKEQETSSKYAELRNYMEDFINELPPQHSYLDFKNENLQNLLLKLKTDEKGQPRSEEDMKLPMWVDPADVKTDEEGRKYIELDPNAAGIVNKLTGNEKNLDESQPVREYLTDWDQDKRRYITKEGMNEMEKNLADMGEEVKTKPFHESLQHWKGRMEEVRQEAKKIKAVLTPPTPAPTFFIPTPSPTPFPTYTSKPLQVKIPEATFKTILYDEQTSVNEWQVSEFTTETLFADKRVAVFAFPNPFHPDALTTWSREIFDSLESLYERFDAVAILTKLDPWAMAGWASRTGLLNSAIMVSDMDNVVSEALGRTCSPVGVGDTCARYSMIVNNGVVEAMTDGDHMQPWDDKLLSYTHPASAYQLLLLDDEDAAEDARNKTWHREKAERDAYENILSNWNDNMLKVYGKYWDEQIKMKNEAWDQYEKTGTFPKGYQEDTLVQNPGEEPLIVEPEPMAFMRGLFYPRESAWDNPITVKSPKHAEATDALIDYENKVFEAGHNEIEEERDFELWMKYRDATLDAPLQSEMGERMLKHFNYTYDEYRGVWQYSDGDPDSDILVDGVSFENATELLKQLRYRKNYEEALKKIEDDPDLRVHRQTFEIYNFYEGPQNITIDKKTFKVDPDLLEKAIAQEVNKTLAKVRGEPLPEDPKLKPEKTPAQYAKENTPPELLPPPFDE